MDYLPAFLKLKNQPCLVVGGGQIAARKASLLCKAGARVTVVASEIRVPIRELARTFKLEIVKKNFEDNDLDGFILVISATGDPAVNMQVANAAKRFNIPVNVVDQPGLCSFIFPAIVDRSPIVAAVSSGGASPVLARLLRARLESLIPAAFGKLARLAETYRSQVKAKITDTTRRRKFWETVLQGPIAEQVFAGREKAAEKLLRDAIEAEANTQPLPGEIYLVGSGPGDPDLLTFRALRLMQQADVVVYDRLVSAEILELVRRDAELIYAGKQRKKHTLPQEQINELLIRLAKAGKKVVRLKGGDPFIFGRGGEEIATLMNEGIAFQVVPGITAASGCASYAGIPLTHRDYAQSCVFVAGHLKDGSVDLNWQQLCIPNQTVVVYMGLVGLEYLCAKLIENKCPADLPIALIQQGTTPNQRVVTGTLQTLPKKVLSADIKPPTLIIIGQVVKLHEKLAWFHTGQMPTDRPSPGMTST